VTMILAGDVGGTKANLALFEQHGTGLRPLFHRRLGTRQYDGFEVLIEAFLQQAQEAGAIKDRASIDAAGFGVAGVVTGGKHYSENLPWMLDVSAVSDRLKLRHIQLLNDLAATALSLEHLSVADCVVLNIGVPVKYGTRGVIAAGTGLGEALLFWNGTRYQVAPAEGGQADFAPRTEREIALLSHLRRQLSHVSCEEIVSGRGFRRIHEFLDPAVLHESFEGSGVNAASDITQRGLAGSCEVCAETVAFWVEILAGATGNFALQSMTLSGMFIAGGIAAKLLQRLQDISFFKSFCGAGKLAKVMEQVPITVVVNEDAPMLGAAHEALHQLQK